MEKKKIVVCGATGNQGGAVINSLSKHDDFDIVAISRDPDGQKSKELSARGIEVKKANLDDQSSLNDAFKGAYGVFGLTLAWSSKGKFVGIDAEVLQGMNIVEACLTNNIKHLVLSTGLTYEGHENVPHGKSKILVEDYAQKKQVPFTIVRPATFMNEIGGSMLPIKNGIVNGLCDHDVKMAWITWHDIGEFVSLFFSDQQQFIGKTIELVGDIASGDDICQIQNKISGKNWRYKPAPRFLLKIFAREIYKMRIGFETMGRPPKLAVWQKRLDQSHEIFPDTITIDAYLQSKKFK